MIGIVIIAKGVLASKGGLSASRFALEAAIRIKLFLALP